MGTPYEQGYELRSVFPSTKGGVMTDEVGAVTGELEAATVIESGRLVVSVRYAGADEWYTVLGSSRPLADVAGGRAGSFHADLHRRTLEALTMPKALTKGNEQPVDVRVLGSDAENGGEGEQS